MANHVTTRVTIDCNEAAQVVVDQWVSTIEGMSTENYKMVWNLFGVPAESVDYKWMSNNVGSKWCYIEEFHDNTFNLISAWNWPDKFVEWLAEKVIALDENSTITVTYEDEMPNFVGYHVFTSIGDRGDTMDYDDLVRIVEAKIPELTRLDEDTDEYFDMLHENIWECVYEWQDAGIMGE